jgi:hypothetical protein
VLRHDYEGLSDRIIWNVVIDELPLKAAVQAIAERAHDAKRYTCSSCSTAELRPPLCPLHARRHCRPTTTSMLPIVLRGPLVRSNAPRARCRQWQWRRLRQGYTPGPPGCHAMGESPRDDVAEYLRSLRPHLPRVGPRTPCQETTA